MNDKSPNVIASKLYTKLKFKASNSVEIKLIYTIYINMSQCHQSKCELMRNKKNSD